ncbi:MAG TPA: YkgJ family cysteine cluster protein, partial [Desulfocapsa sulfexigens]|nr:YkgJ family cysteine cluster protein [Desulfocapsa sulfexigens]
MEQLQLPENVNRIENDEVFRFSCHPGVDCFTDCCRQLELALTPYDVLRLKQETKLDSSSFLERYVIQEQEAEDIFPRFYLTMVDDGQASCVFVAETGCTVYPGRPGACRAYPMGRAAMRKDNNTIEEFFVLLKESHCNGFQEQEEQTTKRYSEGQGLQKYNNVNDKVAALLQHEMIR